MKEETIKNQKESYNDKPKEYETCVQKINSGVLACQISYFKIIKYSNGF